MRSYRLCLKVSCAWLDFSKERTLGIFAGYSLDIVGSAEDSGLNEADTVPALMKVQIEWGPQMMKSPKQCMGSLTRSSEGHGKDPTISLGSGGGDFCLKTEEMIWTRPGEVGDQRGLEPVTDLEDPFPQMAEKQAPNGPIGQRTPTLLRPISPCSEKPESSSSHKPNFDNSQDTK